MLDTHQESLMADVESQASTWTMSSQLMLTILVQGPYLENFCPLYPLLVLMSQQPVCLQDTLFNSIYARHYRPEAVSTSLGICLPNSTKTHFHSSRRQWNAYSLQLSQLTIITTWFWKDGEHLIMNITCLHVPIMCHTVPKHIYDQCTQKYSLKRMM